MTPERDKMLRGDLYNAGDPALIAARMRARSLSQRYNRLAPDDPARDNILRDLLGNVGANVIIESPFYCDYGEQISLADGVYVNMNCVFLDPAAIVIGPQTFLGPSVQLYTATHPLDAKERVAGPESARPINIGSRVWIGGATVVCPGVTIGDDTTIGAGSVVVRDIPSGVLAAGNPCRVIRNL
jgi:maltose O-acetyltransferase